MDSVECARVLVKVYRTTDAIFVHQEVHTGGAASHLDGAQGLSLGDQNTPNSCGRRIAMGVQHTSSREFAPRGECESGPIAVNVRAPLNEFLELLWAFLAENTQSVFTTQAVAHAK